MIKIERPPNFDQILAAFPRAGDHGVLFAYGEDVYNPSGILIAPWLLAHEYRHCARQWERVDAWWDKYLTDPEFRYAEELLAHVEEYVCACKGVSDRNRRAKLQQRTAARLISPLYDYTPPRSLSQAMRDIHLLAH